MRSQVGKDFAWFQGNVPDEMAKQPVQEEEGGWYSWAAFRVNSAEGVYTLHIQPRDDARACAFEYKGTFTNQDGRWSASAPAMVSAGLQQGKP